MAGGLVVEVAPVAGGKGRQAKTDGRMREHVYSIVECDQQMEVTG